MCDDDGGGAVHAGDSCAFVARPASSSQAALVPGFFFGARSATSRVHRRGMDWI